MGPELYWQVYLLPLAILSYLRLAPYWHGWPFNTYVLIPASLGIREFSREFPSELPKEFPREFPCEFLREFPSEFLREFPREFLRGFA